MNIPAKRRPIPTAADEEGITAIKQSFGISEFVVVRFFRTTAQNKHHRRTDNDM